MVDFLNEPKTENKSTCQRDLGVKSVTMNDTLIIQLKLKNNLTAKEMSLSKILTTVARIYDPLGFIAPLVITLKILPQKLWRSGIKLG